MVRARTVRLILISLIFHMTKVRQLLSDGSDQYRIKVSHIYFNSIFTSLMNDSVFT